MPKNELNVYQTNALKGVTETLFGGNFAASVTEANSTSIDMRSWSSGSLDWTLVGNGTGNFAMNLWGSEDNVAPFHPVYRETTAGVVASTGNSASATFTDGWTAFPTITTPTSANANFAVKDIKANYIKFVPTLAGTVSGIFKFTPSNQ